MDLLKYEFQEATNGSYNHTLGKLVKTVRDTRNNVEGIEGNEIRKYAPEINLMEKELQDAYAEFGWKKISYIEEIMEELSKEEDIETELLEEIERACKAIINELFKKKFVMNDFAYEFRNEKAVYWLDFYGYVAEKENDDTLRIVRDVFRSISNMKGVIFIDSGSLSN